MERLQPLVEQAEASDSAAFTVDVCGQVRQSIVELLLMQRHDDDLVSLVLTEQLRWYIGLYFYIPRPPWAEIAVFGQLYSGMYTEGLEQVVARLEQPGQTAEQRRKLLDDAYRSMTAGRSLVDFATYAWHRIGQPAMAGQMIENLAGTLFDTNRFMTAARAATPDPAEQNKIAREHHRLVQKLDTDLPVATHLSTADATKLYGGYFEAQIQRVLTLPRHLRLLAANQLNCAPQIAAIESGRDVVYFAASLHGSAAIRYRSDRQRAASTESIELGSVTSNTTHDWIADAQKIYELYQQRTANRSNLEVVLGRTLRAVGEQVMKPIFEAWPDLDHFSLVPVGTAAPLPFYSALVDGRPACSVRNFTISPSARSLHVSTLFPAQPIGTALVAADPADGRDYLPNAVVEAARVAELYDTDVVGPDRTTPSSDPIEQPPVRAPFLPTPPLRPLAPELAAALDAGMTRSVAHFSCHGLVADFPDLNAYLFIGTGLSLNDFLGEHGRLISPGGVVVLSACSVGGVVDSVPSELIGFPAVLLGAGVRTVIGPVWPVLDSAETVDLVAALHTNMLSGMTATEALADAVRGSFESGAPSAVWGVFGAYGC
jgi:hypothetical protein